MRVRSVVAFLALVMSTLSPGAALAEAAIAAIDVSSREGGITLTGRVVALASGDYEARMTIDKSGPSGTTRTTQGGALSLGTGTEGTVAVVGLSMAAGDRLSVELVVTLDERAVSSSSLTVGD